MITLSSSVRDCLRTLSVPVWYFYPAGWSQLPVVSWRESLNRSFARADGGEHLAELEYSVDIWSSSPAECAEISVQIDALLAALHLRRDYSADLFDAPSGMHHRSLRYRCISDAAGNVYQ